jgi:hypothetical protein
LKRKRPPEHPRTRGRAAPSPRDLAAAIQALASVRAPLHLELAELLKDPAHAAYGQEHPAHLQCERGMNQMRITPLEAEAIAEALRTRPELRRKLPGIRRKLRAELERLADSTARQNFTCPLLEGKLCLVHGTAKPIGCLAWNPGREYSDAGWFAFERRDALNDALYGPGWKLRAIPLWLARVLGEEAGISPRRRRPPSEAARTDGSDRGRSSRGTSRTRSSRWR